jgi:hypothetical protein
MQGLMTLLDLALYRPLVSSHCLERLLRACRHTKIDVRRVVIQKAVLKR